MEKKNKKRQFFLSDHGIIKCVCISVFLFHYKRERVSSSWTLHNFLRTTLHNWIVFSLLLCDFQSIYQTSSSSGSCSTLLSESDSALEYYKRVAGQEIGRA